MLLKRVGTGAPMSSSARSSSLTCHGPDLWQGFLVVFFTSVDSLKFRHNLNKPAIVIKIWSQQVANSDRDLN